MSDERLEQLRNAVAEPSAPYGDGPVRVTRLKISNYKFFAGDFELDCNANNVLIYGENGTGKSSVYRALEYLTRTRFAGIAQDRNIFAGEGEPRIEFSFSNGTELLIHSDLEALPDSVDFLKGLAIFSPVLDYKKLLKIHFIPQANGELVNIYGMLRQLFKDFPVEHGRRLGDIEDFQEYFKTLENVVNGDLLGEINTLIRFFDDSFAVSRFRFTTKLVEGGIPEPRVHIEIDYRESLIDAYHTFLNEARLSALAISVYFAAIKKLLGTLTSDCLRILVLDDLLISLDMSNRLKLLEILKNEFSAFQIFFFTHDKELFEIYKNKIPWEKYELYLDDSGPIHSVIVKKGESALERSKKFYATKEYDACALLLRKEFEKVLKAYLSPRERMDRNCNELDLAAMIGKSIAKSSGEARTILRKLDSDRKHILNPLSHNDDRNIYAQEVKSAIADLEKLKNLLK